MNITLDDTPHTEVSNFQNIRHKEGDGSESESEHEQDKPLPDDYQENEDEEEKEKKALAKLLAQRQKEVEKFKWLCDYEKAKQDLRAGKLDEIDFTRFPSLQPPMPEKIKQKPYQNVNEA